jgi:phosphate uptake regulator
MKRKVIQLAKRTYVVSLPSEWAKKYNIKKGAEVEVEVSGNKVIISTTAEASGDSITIDLTGSLPITKRILAALYKSGYDEINASFASDDERKAIEEVVKDAFVGFEISYEGKNNAVIKEISKANYDKFEEMLNRVFLIVKTMAADSLQAIKTGNKKLKEEVVSRDWDVNRLSDFCRRVLNKRGFLLFKRSSPVYFIVEQIEKVADCYKEICRDSELKPSKELEKLFAEVNSFFDMFYSAFYKFELKAAVELGRKKVELAKLSKDVASKAKDEEIGLIDSLNSIIELTYDMNGALMASKL